MNYYLSKIEKLGIKLPALPHPAGSYHPVIISDHTAYLSGQIAKRDDGSIVSGRLGETLNVDQGKEAARIAALNLVSVVANLIGFEKFDHFLRLVGYVQTSGNFFEISQVMNGASDLLVQIFEDKGVHARSAVGVASLPLNSAVEIEATIRLR